MSYAEGGARHLDASYVYHRSPLTVSTTEPTLISPVVISVEVCSVCRIF